MDIKIQKIKSDVLFKTKSLTNAENLNSDEELIITVIKIILKIMKLNFKILLKT